MSLKRLLFVLPLIWMVVIFMYSAKNAENSTAESMRISVQIFKIIYSDYETMEPEVAAQKLETVDFLVRKTAHATEYAILGALVLIAVMNNFALSKKLLILISWGFSTIYAASDEIHQLFVPGRAGKLADVVLDSAGAIIGVIVTFLIAKSVNKVIKKLQNKPKNSSNA